MVDPAEETAKTSSTKGDEASPTSDAVPDTKEKATVVARSDEDRISDMEEKAKRLDDIVVKNEVTKEVENNDPPRKKGKKSRASRVEDAFEGCSECCGDCCVGCECVIS